MAGTLVVQSHRKELPYQWIEYCLGSVVNWCEFNQYEYQFIHDEIFETVPDDLLEKIADQKVVATDLARLYVLKNGLEQGYGRVVWLDSDFLIFDPSNFKLPEEDYAVGREVWVQADGRGKLKVYKKVHNAFLMFRQGNSFLNYYLETAERLLRRNQGNFPNQFIGPKLLTALHNVAQLNVMEESGMLSPLVIKDIIKSGGKALRSFVHNSSQSVRGANLCVSSCDRKEVSCAEMEQAIKHLVNDKLLFSG